MLKTKGISDPTEMPFIVLKGADGVKLHPSKCLLQVSTILMIKTVCISVNFDLEFERQFQQELLPDLRPLGESPALPFSE